MRTLAVKGILAPLAALVLAALASLRLGPSQVAFAHANLARAEPAPNSVLAQPPQRVVLWFTEPVEPRFSEIHVLNDQGQRVDKGDAVVDGVDATSMSVSLPELPHGTYTVSWRNLSAMDGHPVRGSFVFSVGEVTGHVGEAPPGQPLLPHPLDPLFRWLVLLAGLAVVGGQGFYLLVANPALKGKGPDQGLRYLNRLLTWRIIRIIWASSSVFLVASAGQLLVQTAVVHGIPLSQALDLRHISSVVTGTNWGTLWLWRIALLLALGLLLTVSARGRLRPPGPGDGGPLNPLLAWAALLLGMGMLLPLSLVSHAAATAEAKAATIFSDYLHLLASAFWVGGLFHLALGVPLFWRSVPDSVRREALAALVPRFSALATLSVGTLIITGLFSAWAQVTALAAVKTPYGLSLVAKVAVLVPLLLLGALNLLWVRPRLARPGKAGQWLRRFVAGEATLASVVLLAVGFLTAMEPARQAASRQGLGQPQGLEFHDTVEGTDIALIIEPGRVGPNQFTVSLKDRLGRPITNASQVLLGLTYLDQDLGKEEVAAASVGDGRYAVENGLLSLEGPWQVALLVVRPGAFDARTAFRFELPGAATAATIAPSPQVGRLLWGVELALLGVLFLGTGVALGGWWTRVGVATMGSGALALLGGVFLLANAQLLTPGKGVPQQNPFPPTHESLALGRQLYQEHCQQCHGEAGRGDGPLAPTLDTPPLDLVVHVPLHPDRQLFLFVHDGVAGTAMAPWGGRLADEEIWHLVNYIRTFRPVEQ